MGYNLYLSLSLSSEGFYLHDSFMIRTFYRLAIVRPLRRKASPFVASIGTASLTGDRDELRISHSDFDFVWFMPFDLFVYFWFRRSGSNARQHYATIERRNNLNCTIEVVSWRPHTIRRFVEWPACCRGGLPIKSHFDSKGYENVYKKVIKINKLVQQLMDQ